MPVLRLYDGTGQAGHFQPGRGRMVGWQKRTLHRWHIQTGISERTAKTPKERLPLAEFQFKQNKWLLANLAIPDLRVVTFKGTQRGIRQIGLNETLSLEDGQQLLLGTDGASGQPKTVRLALVTMQKL